MKSDWPRTYYVEKAGLDLDLLFSASPAEVKGVCHNA